MSKEKSWFGKDSSNNKDGILSSAGNGAKKVVTVVGAGILCSMGFSAFKSASTGN